VSRAPSQHSGRTLLRSQLYAAQRVDERSAGWLVDESRAQPPKDRPGTADLGLRP